MARVNKAPAQATAVDQAKRPRAQRHFNSHPPPPTTHSQHIKCQQSCCGRNREEPFSIWGGRGTYSGPKRGFVGFLIFRKQHRGGGGKHFPGGEAGDHPNADPPIPTQRFDRGFEELTGLTGERAFNTWCGVFHTWEGGQDPKPNADGTTTVPAFLRNTSPCIKSL